MRDAPRPARFPLLAVLALPFRLPISDRRATVNLLIPLYLVVAAGPSCTCCRGCWRGERRARRGRGPSRTRLAFWSSPRGVEWLLLAAVVLYALQALYSADHRQGRREHRLLLPAVRRCCSCCCAMCAGRASCCCAASPWRSRWRCCSPASASSSTTAKSLFLNPKVVAANQYDNYFRVNSLFFDPSIYGRFLALVMVAVAAAVLGRRRRLRPRAPPRRADRRRRAARGCWPGWSRASRSRASPRCCWGWRCSPRGAGTCARPYTCRWRCWRSRAVVLVAAPPSLHFGLKGSGGSTNNATSGRTNLISGGLELFAERPLEGYGSGSFETEYKRHSKASEASAENATSASHTIPVTVAAEQGIIGLAVYVALLVARLPRAVRRRRRARPPGSLSLPASRRWCCTRGRMPTSSRIRSPGRCWGSASRSRAERDRSVRPRSATLGRLLLAPVEPRRVVVSQLMASVSDCAAHAALADSDRSVWQ